MHQLAKKLTKTYLPLYDASETGGAPFGPEKLTPDVAGASLPNSGLSACVVSADFRVASSPMNSSTTTPTATAVQRAVCPCRAATVALTLSAPGLRPGRSGPARYARSRPHHL